MRITENGMGVQDEYRFRNHAGQIQDDYRIDYVKKHLIWAYQAIQDGANLKGCLLYTSKSIKIMICFSTNIKNY